MEQIWHNNFCFPPQTKFATILWNESGTIFFATILFYNTFISHDNQSLPRSGTTCFVTILFYNTFISHNKQILLSIMEQIGYKNFLYPQETKYGIVLRSKSSKYIIFLSLFFVEGFYHSFGT